MNINDFLEYMKTQKRVDSNSEVYGMFHELSQEALKITMEINNKYHTPEELVELFSALTGKPVDKTFRVFPPFYTDCGKNITIGKDVFINMCCKFQDQGGIIIGDGCLIGHNVILATLNHDINPKTRASLNPAPITLGKNVWLGAGVTVLGGVTIGDNSIVGAGSIVTKDIPPNCIAYGSPCKVIRTIDKI